MPRWLPSRTCSMIHFRVKRKLGHQGVRGVEFNAEIYPVTLHRLEQRK
jgi:hypothetical protein